MELLSLTRKDAVDDAYMVSERNIEIATAYALRAAARWKVKAPPWMDKDQFDESVIMAVLRSAKRYDPGKDTSFFTYAHSMVNGALKEEWRKQNKRKPDLSLDECVGFTGSQSSETVRYIDLIEDRGYNSTDEAMVNIQFNEIMSVADHLLTEREKIVLELRFIQQLKQSQVAEHIGVTASRVNQIEGEIVAKLRRVFDGEDTA